MFLTRWATDSLLRLLQNRRIVSVIGCPRSGKTTLVSGIAPPGTRFRSLNDQAELEAAVADPAFFVRQRQEAPLVIDGAEKAPALHNEILRLAAARNGDAPCIIAGSVDFQKLPGASGPLVQSAALLRLRPLCEAEQRGMPHGFLKACVKRRLPLSEDFDCNNETIMAAAIRGGLPEVLTLSAPEERGHWHASYLEHLALPNLRALSEARKPAVLKKALVGAARMSGSELNKAVLSDWFDIAWRTLDRYWSALEALLLIDKVEGWADEELDRARKTPRFFLADSGLMARCLGISRPDDVLSNFEKLRNEGQRLVETWVYNQLMPEIDLLPGWRLRHFRSRSHEISFLVTDDAGRTLGLQVKGAESVRSDDFRHLRWLQEQVGPERFTGRILYAGDQVISGGDGLFAIPLAALWSDFSRWEAP